MQSILIEIIFSILIVLSVYFGTKSILKNQKNKDFIIKHKIFHPNSISYFRIPMGVISMILFYYGFEISSTLLFAFVCITDGVDGMIARSCNLVSELGKSLDPLADKLVYFAPIMYFGLIGKLNIFLVIIFIIIESLGQFSRIILKKLKLETKANNYGKIKTSFVFILVFYLMIFEDKNIINMGIVFNNILLIIAIIFALLSIVFKFLKTKNA